MGHDVVTFGETMVRLSPPGFRRLEQATALDVAVGGSEMNTAVATARLGLSAAFVTRLTRNPLGRMVENKVREHGVCTSHFVWTDDDRVGTYFVEFGSSPRANSVLYDRANSAMARIQPGEVHWQSALEGAKVFHTSGITPALSPSAAEATLEGVRAAAELGVKISVDLNYRKLLWSPHEAQATMSKILEQASILFTTEEDTQRVFGIEGNDFEDVARKLIDAFGLEVVAITLRENPSVWNNRWTAIACRAGDDKVYRAPVFDLEIVDRVGAGDAFGGGFLYGYLNEGIEAGVRYGVGISALKQTHPGDLCWATRDEVDRILDGEGLRIVR